MGGQVNLRSFALFYSGFNLIFPLMLLITVGKNWASHVNLNTIGDFFFAFRP